MLVIRGKGDPEQTSAVKGNIMHRQMIVMVAKGVSGGSRAMIVIGRGARGETLESYDSYRARPEARGQRPEARGQPRPEASGGQRRDQRRPAPAARDNDDPAHAAEKDRALTT